MTPEPRVGGLPRDESDGYSRPWSGSVRRRGGMSVVLAFISNRGTSRVVVLGKPREPEYTEARKPKARVLRYHALGRTGVY